MMTMSTAARMLTVEGTPVCDTNLKVRGRHSSQHAMAATPANPTVHSAWPDMVLSATAMVTVALPHVMQILTSREMPTMTSSGRPPTTRAMSTMLTQCGCARQNCSSSNAV